MAKADTPILQHSIPYTRVLNLTYNRLSPILLTNYGFTFDVLMSFHEQARMPKVLFLTMAEGIFFCMPAGGLHIWLLRHNQKPNSSKFLA